MVHAGKRKLPPAPVGEGPCSEPVETVEELLGNLRCGSIEQCEVGTDSGVDLMKGMASVGLLPEGSSDDAAIRNACTVEGENLSKDSDVFREQAW